MPGLFLKRKWKLRKGELDLGKNKPFVCYNLSEPVNIISVFSDYA